MQPFIAALNTPHFGYRNEERKGDSRIGVEIDNRIIAGEKMRLTLRV